MVTSVRDFPPPPQFDGFLKPDDAELLLQYLTTPYLRIPLLLGFFGTGDRVYALSSRQLQRLLERAILEPGAFQADSNELQDDLDTIGPKACATRCEGDRMNSGQLSVCSRGA